MFFFGLLLWIRLLMMVYASASLLLFSSITLLGKCSLIIVFTFPVVLFPDPALPPPQRGVGGTRALAYSIITHVMWWKKRCRIRWTAFRSKRGVRYMADQSQKWITTALEPDRTGMRTGSEPDWSRVGTRSEPRIGSVLLHKWSSVMLKRLYIGATPGPNTGPFAKQHAPDPRFRSGFDLVSIRF